MSSSITPDVRSRIDAHLDAVEAKLATLGIAREKRRGIVDDLEAQILDMLADAGSVTVEDVDAMLARLDPPEAYANSDGPVVVVEQVAATPIVEPRFCVEAKRGLLWIIASLVAAALMVTMLTPHQTSYQTTSATMTNGVIHTTSVPKTPQPQTYFSMLVPLVAGLAALLITPCVGTVLGWVAIARIRDGRGQLYGLAVAVFDALFYPTIAVWFFAFSISNLIGVAYYDGSFIPNRGRAVMIIGTIGLGIAFTALLVWMMRRFWRANVPAMASAPVGVLSHS